MAKEARWAVYKDMRLSLAAHAVCKTPKFAFNELWCYVLTLHNKKVNYITIVLKNNKLL